MPCPLYKRLKANGTTFYAFPGAAEDISAAYQNENYKMYFSKFILLNLPKQETVFEPKYFDFENSFKKSPVATEADNFSDAIIESLRNYVANNEVVMRESKLNNTEYYYDNNSIETSSEKIFWKWCKKLNLIDFEPAIPDDEYFRNLSTFQPNNINDDEYLPEFLWKEREIIDWNISEFTQSVGGNLEIKFTGITNFKVGDTVNIYNVSNQEVIDSVTDIDTEEGIQTEILNINGEVAEVDIPIAIGTEGETTGKARIVYNRLVRYIGEVTGVSNVQEQNRSYTSVYATIPDHVGETPDILFRTKVDNNYKPNMTFPIIPSQYQPEILGTEFFNSPIVSQPQNYPGSYFGQFDTLDFTYKTESGDSLRRSGNYYGVKGDVNNIEVDGSTLDGINVDFDRAHYVKMNIPNRIATNFDQFNALEVNNEPPKDFEFNAILWYYSVEDEEGGVATNLYGISFLDHPNNNPVSVEKSLRFPTVKKLVSNGQQDGTSYGYNLGLNFNIINENPTETYNPEAINALFSMDLFNSVMSKLASVNDSFMNILAEQLGINEEMNNLKGLVYTQPDLEILKSRMSNIEDLLKLYATKQISESDTISVNTIPGAPPLIKLNNISTEYIRIDNVKSSELYNVQGVIPKNINVPNNRNLLINLVNDDGIVLELPDKLSIILDGDLKLNQSVEFKIIGSESSSENKKLDIFMVSDIGSEIEDFSEVLLIGDIDLPVMYNPVTELPNSAYLWKKFNFEIDFEKEITLISQNQLKVPFIGNLYIINNSIKEGDVIYLNNLFITQGSVVYDFSGQYTVDGLDGTEYVVFDISSNESFISAFSTGSFPLTVHSNTSTLLANMPYFSLNKGKYIKITRISDSETLTDRYQVTQFDFM